MSDLNELDNFNKIKSVNIKKLWIFLLFTAISLSMHYFQEISILKYSFKIHETAMHEFGHGFTSMLFGGDIISLNLDYNSGYIKHITPKWATPIVSFMGYTSASLFGFIIYASSLYSSKYIKILLISMATFWFIYAENITTFLILSIIIATLLVSWYWKKYGCLLLRFIGVYIMVSSIYSPTYLWAYSDKGDHISLSQQTYIPSFFWISLWFLIGLFFMYKAFKISKKH